MIERDGKQYARVTEILASQNDFSGIDPIILAKKCAIGVQVHKAISDDINEEFPVLDETTINYFNSYVKWKNELQAHFIESETRYFDDKYMFTGQIDGVVKLNGNDSYNLIDFKTSANENRTVWNLQAHFYYYLLSQRIAYGLSDKILFVKLDKDAKLPKVFIYEYDKNTMDTCLDMASKFFSNSKNT